jgi:hypothetical protein
MNPFWFQITFVSFLFSACATFLYLFLNKSEILFSKNKLESQLENCLVMCKLGFSLGKSENAGLFTIVG